MCTHKIAIENFIFVWNMMHDVWIQYVKIALISSIVEQIRKGYELDQQLGLSHIGRTKLMKDEENYNTVKILFRVSSKSDIHFDGGRTQR